MERPNAARAVQAIVRGLVARHRPALAFTFSNRLEYLDIAVTDPRALLAPVGSHLGKRMMDIAPPQLMEQIDRKIHAAKQTHGPQVQRYTGLDGDPWDAKITVPNPDVVMIHVNEVLG